MINTLIKKERTVLLIVSYHVYKTTFFIKYKTPLKSKENALKHNFVMHNQSRPYHGVTNKISYRTQLFFPFKDKAKIN